MRLYHGTSSDRAALICREGFMPPSYFTTALEDAEYYAATGGEASLQLREEQYEESTGINVRELFYPDMWDMYQILYPNGQLPVVIELDLPAALVARLKEDAGAHNGRVANFVISKKCITRVLPVTWPSDASSETQRECCAKERE